MDIKKLFGANVKRYRKIKRFSQEQLSERLSITSKHLGVIENGLSFASADLIEKLAKELDVSVAALFYSSEEIAGTDTFLEKIDRVLTAEIQAVLINIKSKIRE